MLVRDPTKKSNAANNIITSSRNCSLITHLTPAILMVPRSITAATAKALAAHVLSVVTKFAIDSPKPNTFKAHPTAWKSKNYGFYVLIQILDAENISVADSCAYVTICLQFDLNSYLKSLFVIYKGVCVLGK